MPTETQTAPIVNRVASSGLVTFNLEDFQPHGERVLMDIKDQLHMGLLLKEQEFRDWAKAHDWAQYQGKFVAVTCTADAIVPVWPYMLIATKLQNIAAHVVFGDLDALETDLIRQRLATHDWTPYEGAKIVVKGCGNVPTAAYLEAARQLAPRVAKLMYGEPCSMVPLFKDLSRAK